jgi:phosphatidylserine/phosphatidylglycerophosphate/cardiolipin synthase-like enzyme
VHLEFFRHRPAILALFALALAGCALGPEKQLRIDERIAIEQGHAIECITADACAMASPFHPLIDQADGKHRALLLDGGADAFRIRLHMIRAARRSIDIQTFIFQDEPSSRVLLDELLAAARRGVHVRLLTDQMLSFNDTNRLAQLALVHSNFELRFYNPTFNEARTQAWEFLAGALCCFSRFNQRMHSKLFAIDDAMAIIGGRNYRDSYFDLDPDFAYYDRDILVMGPVAADMTASFDVYWNHRRSVPAPRLDDVGKVLLRDDALPVPSPRGADTDTDTDTDAAVTARMTQLGNEAGDADLIRSRFVDRLAIVDDMRFVSDAPVKLGSRRPDANAVSRVIAELFGQARHDVLLQTPYLILGRDSRRMFRTRRETHPDIVVRVSTNSLAATDAYPVYALTYKYKKRYMRELGFRIHEMKPYPDELHRMVETFVDDRLPRVSMHAKCAVIDGEISLVGTHNFDPRSDRFNTEGAVIIRDREFAQRLSESILRDMSIANSWVVAPRERGPAPFYRLSRWIESLSTALPVFDLWPFRYASSFEALPGCPPLAPDHPDFYRCYRDIGDFPRVDSLWKRFMTRLVTAFGAPMMPVL